MIAALSASVRSNSVGAWRRGMTSDWPTSNCVPVRTRPGSARSRRAPARFGRLTIQSQKMQESTREIEVQCESCCRSAISRAAASISFACSPVARNMSAFASARSLPSLSRQLGDRPRGCGRGPSSMRPRTRQELVRWARCRESASPACRSAPRCRGRRSPSPSPRPAASRRRRRGRSRGSPGGRCCATNCATAQSPSIGTRGGGRSG